MINNLENDLLAIKQEILALTKSPLYDYRLKSGNLPVIGEGNHQADLMFVGEAPGKNEALKGRPFCGSAGKILDELLLSANLERADVYITNIVKDRPPANRDPLPAEIEIYTPFLERQINLIKPQVIAGLGRFASAYLLEKFSQPKNTASISQIHGRLFPGQTVYGSITIIPLYHPAATIYNPKLKNILKADFKHLAGCLKNS
jgi:uracil-DNA glycosylase